MDRSRGTGKAESFSTKPAIYYLLTQLDVHMVFPESVYLNHNPPKCFIVYVFVSNKKPRKCVRPLYALNYVAGASSLNFQI